MKNDIDFQQFIERHVEALEPLSRDAGLANWEFQTTSSPASKRRALELNARLTKLYSDSGDYEYLRTLSAGSRKTPWLDRQRSLLLRRYQSAQMDHAVIEEMLRLEIEIEDRFNVYRATVGGKEASDNAIDDILNGSLDTGLRREAWEASKMVGLEVQSGLLDLVRLRNREARRLGFRNFYSMQLELTELDQNALFDLLEDLRARSEPLWQDYKGRLDAALAARFNITPDDVRPWHHANRFFQEPEACEADLDRFFGAKNLAELTARFYTAIGLPVEDLLERSDLYERPGKSQHAFCMDIDRRGDVRVLCNIRPNERWMETMLHEFGHAVYDKYQDPSLPYLLRGPAHTLTTEGIALFMGRLVRNPEWLVNYADVPREEARRIAASAQKQVSDQMLVFMHWCFVVVHFERSLYENPDQDLNTLWWDLVERYQGVRRPEGRNAPDWASKIHIATAPVYYQNYLLGEMAASQLLHTLETKVLAGEPNEALVCSSKVGAYLRDRLFYPGALRDWNGWLEHGTGEKLNPKYFIDHISSPC